jgi:hypothetical protein
MALAKQLTIRKLMIAIAVVSLNLAAVPALVID